MSHPAEAPVVADRRRPTTVVLAAALLVLLAVVGLGYAATTLAIVPGTVERLRTASTVTAGTGTADTVDSAVRLLWLSAIFAVAVGVLLFVLYGGLVLRLSMGSNTARVATWVVCALGLLSGAVSAVVVLTQYGVSGARAVHDAYPGGWIALNIVMSVAQMLGYAAVAGLLVGSPGAFFASGGAATAAEASPGKYASYGALPGMAGLAGPAGGSTPASSDGVAGSAGPGPYGVPDPSTSSSDPARSRHPGAGADDSFWSRPSP